MVETESIGGTVCVFVHRHSGFRSACVAAEIERIVPLSFVGTTDDTGLVLPSHLFCPSQATRNALFEHVAATLLRTSFADVLFAPFAASRPRIPFFPGAHLSSVICDVGSVWHGVSPSVSSSWSIPAVVRLELRRRTSYLPLAVFRHLFASHSTRCVEARSRVESGRRASGLESASPSTFRCARIAVGVRDLLPVDVDACRPVHLAYPFGLVGIGFGLDASPSFVLLLVDPFRGAFLDSLSSFLIAWHLPHSGCLDRTDPTQHQPQAQEPVPSPASGLFSFPMCTCTFGFTTIGQGGAFRRRGWRTWVLVPPCRFHSGSILGGWGLGFGERETERGTVLPVHPNPMGFPSSFSLGVGPVWIPPVPKEREDGGPPRSGQTEGKGEGGEKGGIPVSSLGTGEAPSHTPLLGGLWDRGWRAPPSSVHRSTQSTSCDHPPRDAMVKYAREPDSAAKVSVRKQDEGMGKGRKDEDGRKQKRRNATTAAGSGEGREETNERSGTKGCRRERSRVRTNTRGSS